MKCAFCPTEAAELSGEHIWDDWLNRELPTKRFNVRTRRALTEPYRRYEAKRLNEKLFVVRRRCNNEWMSDLTNDVKRSFSALIIEGRPLSILPCGLALLSAFAFLKAIVGDCATQKDNDEPFFSIAARERFRRSLTIPAAVQIWIASFYGAHAYSGRFVSGILSASSPGPLCGAEFMTFTYVVGHLVLQLVAPRWKDIRDRGRILPILRPDTYWDSAAVRFWPRDEFHVSWPPPKRLGDDVLKAFTDRFNVPINL
jgi:hypothetical protein